MKENLETKRDALVRRLLSPPPYGQGIYGYPVCQDCGEVGSYQGMYGAMGSHRATEYGSRFSDASHSHSLDFERAFCQVCREPIEPSRLGICSFCQEVSDWI